MNFILSKLVEIGPFLLSIPPIVYLFMKVMSRDHIEIVLGDKYKNKMNDLAQTLIISLMLAIVISMSASSWSANSLSEESFKDVTTNVLSIILLFVFLLFIATLLISFISLNVNLSRKTRKKQGVLTFHKWNFGIQFISILCIDAMLFIVISDQGNVEEKAILVVMITIMYIVSILLLNSNMNRVVKNKNYYEIKVINKELNETLENLILLYSLNKEMLIMRKKADVNKSIHDLEEFHVYYLNAGFIHRYRKHPKIEMK